MRNTRSTSKRRTNSTREFRLPANVMQEEAWEDDGPSMKLSRAFAVVLLLHIVAVAGLVAFHFFEDNTAPVATNDPQLPEKKKPNTSTNDATVIRAEGASAPAGGQENGIMLGMKPVKVEGSTTTSIFAAEWGITEQMLLSANLRSGLIPGTLRPGQELFVPEHATRLTKVDDLPIAPKTDPPKTDPPKTETPPKREIAQSTPPRREATTRSSNKPKTQDRPPATTPKPKTTPQAQPHPPRHVTKAKTPSRNTVRAQAAGGKKHTVKKGENLFRISLKYGVTVPALQRANGLSNPNDLKAGQTLVIPK